MVLQLSTTQNVFLIIVTVAVSLFFLMGVFLLIASLVLVSQLKKIVSKAELAIDSAEAAAETIAQLGKKAGGPLAILKLVAHIVNGVKKK